MSTRRNTKPYDKPIIYKYKELMMSRFAKFGLIVISIILLPIIVVTYYNTVKDFVNHMGYGQYTRAQIISYEESHFRTAISCIINYRYTVQGEFFNGSDSRGGTCSDDMRYVTISYFPDDPEKSVIGFHVFFLFLPIFLIFIPIVVRLKQRRDAVNRAQTSIRVVLLYMIFLLIVIVVVLLPLVSPLAMSDVYSYIFTSILAFIGFHVARDMYINIVRQHLYRYGMVVHGKITDSKKHKFPNEYSKWCATNSGTVSYSFIFGNKKLSGNDEILLTEASMYKEGDTVKLLVHSDKPHRNCIDH